MREPDLPSAPPPSLARSAINVFPFPNSVHDAPRGERDEVFSDYDVLNPMHGLEVGVHRDVSRMALGGRSRQADMVELPIPLKSRSFTSVTADDSEEIEGAASGNFSTHVRTCTHTRAMPHVEIFGARRHTL